jgi:hypothetical protein
VPKALKFVMIESFTYFVNDPVSVGVYMMYWLIYYNMESLHSVVAENILLQGMLKRVCYSVRTLKLCGLICNSM